MTVLQQIRRAHGARQVDVAHAAELSQARVSAIELTPPDRMEVDTLLRYLTAVGGTFHLVFAEGRLELVDVCHDTAYPIPLG